MLVDAGDAPPHEAVLDELPVLVAVGAEPVIAIVMVFVREADGDVVAGEGPQLFDQAVVELPLPATGHPDGSSGVHRRRVPEPTHHWWNRMEAAPPECYPNMHQSKIRNKTTTE